MSSQATLPVDVSAVEQASSLPLEKTQAAISKFAEWLEQYGETSYDFQTFYASDLGQQAKALYYKKPLLGLCAVAPMVFSFSIGIFGAVSRRNAIGILMSLELVFNAVNINLVAASRWQP